MVLFCRAFICEGGGGVFARKAAVYGFTKIYGINVLLRAWLCLLGVPPISVRLSTGQPGWRRLGIRY